ncbi:hypothetical protein MKK75_17860 [Methylobacterium sp. J-030]|uniref:hypothetical protein n=1 Tax=Methylobacterium sp. J-030 TaxID=2836627 RepID=UPI001FB95A2B|nr:hypothetical protein [Methylobacterium sp. J-030]MCJ2070635.1 hypothetical protein [Methylobacterium sp. J-030]
MLDRANSKHNSAFVKVELIHKTSIDKKKIELKTYLYNEQKVIHPLDWFLLRAEYLNYKPVIISFYNDNYLTGCLLLYQKKIFAFPTGVYISPYECGHCSYIGRTENKFENLSKAISMISKRLVFGKIALFVENADNHAVSSEINIDNKENISITVEPKGSYFPLKSNFEETINVFSQKTRKNLRHYRRIAEDELGCRYKPDLDISDALMAVKILNTYSYRSMGLSLAIHRCRMTLLLPGGFSAGLIDKNGNWVSYISGWRTADITYIDWQINEESSNRYSHSISMRSFLIENEIARGTGAIYFLGGANPTWENACSKHEIMRITKISSKCHARIASLIFSFVAKYRPIDRSRKTFNRIFLILTS